jgi:hypothetical protein
MRQHKVDSVILQQMLSEGRSQRECARHFKVTDTAISKRVRRMEAEKPPESFKNLTAKEQQFVLARAEGKGPTDAAMEAFDCSTKESGHTIGTRLSRDPKIQESIHDLLFDAGMGREARIRRLRTLVYAKDLGISHKGLDTAFKLAGDYAPE